MVTPVATRDEIIAVLSDIEHIEQALAQRIRIVRVIIDEKGNEIGRIYRDSFQRSRDSQNREPHTKEFTHE